MTMVPTSPAQTRVHIRWMIRRDMPEVLAIEHANFEYPWCEEEFLRVLRQRNCIGMVAEHGERIVGFMIYELHRNKIHVLDFSTHAEFCRRGVGRQMIAKRPRLEVGSASFGDPDRAPSPSRLVRIGQRHTRPHNRHHIRSTDYYTRSMDHYTRRDFQKRNALRAGNDFRSVQSALRDGERSYAL